MPATRYQLSKTLCAYCRDFSLLAKGTHGKAQHPLEPVTESEVSEAVFRIIVSAFAATGPLDAFYAAVPSPWAPDPAEEER
jgi:hypothetical protein